MKMATTHLHSLIIYFYMLSAFILQGKNLKNSEIIHICIYVHM